MQGTRRDFTKAVLLQCPRDCKFMKEEIFRDPGRSASVLQDEELKGCFESLSRAGYDLAR